MKKTKNLKSTNALDRLFDFHQMMLHEHLYMLYEGTITQELMTAFLSVIKFRIKKLVDEKRTLRKVAFIMIECLQNVAKHATYDKKTKLNRYPSIFLFGISDGNYVIETGNLIHYGKSTKLETKLNQLNKLDHTGLINLYKDKLLKTNISKKGMVGLGLINIAILSKEKLEFNFKKINIHYAFFSLRIKIPKRG